MKLVLVMLILSCCLLSCTSTKDRTLCGKWVSEPMNGSLAMFLTLSEDGTFSMGDKDDDRKSPGVSGTWTANKDRVVLKCQTSESCKVREGQEIEFAYQTLGDWGLEISEIGSASSMRKFKRYTQPDASRKSDKPRR